MYDRIDERPKTTSEAIELAGGRTLISRLGAAGMMSILTKDSPLWDPHE